MAGLGEEHTIRESTRCITRPCETPRPTHLMHRDDSGGRWGSGRVGLVAHGSPTGRRRRRSPTARDRAGHTGILPTRRIGCPSDAQSTTRVTQEVAVAASKVHDRLSDRLRVSPGNRLLLRKFDADETYGWAREDAEAEQAAYESQA